MFKPFALVSRRFCLSLIVAVAAASVLPSTSLRAQEKPPELSERTSTAIGKLQPLFEGKKWDEIIALLDPVLEKTDKNTYDWVFMTQIKAQALAQKGQPITQYLEEAYQVADRLKLFDNPNVSLPIKETESMTYLASLYFQEAQTSGRTIAQQRASYAKAYDYAVRLVNSSKKPSAEHQRLVAQITYYQATVDPNKIDTGAMKKALEEAQKLTRLSIHPKEDDYMLVLAAYQQIGDNAAAADLVELLVAKYPNNKTFWQLLFNSYLAQQGQELRAILTMERAQAVGQMKTPKDNFTLAGLYYNAQQFDRAVEILEKGLRDGSIESEQKNWELLADAYMRQNKEDQAIKVFQEASKRFPKIGAFDLQVGQIYYNRDNQEQALNFMRSAVNKGLENQGQLAQTYYFIAFLSLDLQRLDEAFAAAKKAVELDPRSKPSKDLLTAIESSIAEREQFRQSR